MIDETTFDKQLVKGRELATSGRLAEAEAVLRDALTRVRGRHDSMESRACGSLGTFYAIQGRHFEALVLYRRGLAIDGERRADLQTVRHLSNIATVSAQLGLRDRLPALFDALARAHRRLGADDAKKAESLDLWARLQLALEDGDLPYAQELVELLRETWGRIEEPRIHVNLAVAESDLLLASERDADARAVLERALQTEGISAADRVDLEIRRLGCLEAEGRGEEAGEAARSALEQVAHMLGEPMHAARTIEHGTTLGDVFTRRGELDPAHAAYDIAATATMERIRQLEDCMRELPELTTAEDTEYEWLRALSDRFRTQQQALLRHVAAQLDAARRAGNSPLHEGPGTHDLVRLCAWCGTVGTPSGQWLPIAHYVPESESVRVTHTICERCASRMRGTG